MKDIVIKGLYKNYGEKKVLENFSTVFPAGRCSCVMGESGSGKTTLLRLITGLVNADSGIIEGNDGGLSVVFQEDRLCEEFSIASNIRMVSDENISDDRIKGLLGELMLYEDISTEVKSLSGGMKRRVAIARALIYGRDWLILDEPFRGLDEQSKKQTAKVIRKYADSIIMVSHSKKEAEMMEADIVYLRE